MVDELYSQTYMFSIGEEVILTQVIDTQNCYAIDTIESITINKEGIFYNFETSEAQIKQEDIVRHTLQNVRKLEKDDYKRVGAYIIMS